MILRTRRYDREMRVQGSGNLMKKPNSNACGKVWKRLRFIAATTMRGSCKAGMQSWFPNWNKNTSLYFDTIPQSVHNY